jgi:hypothetical protein
MDSRLICHSAASSARSPRIPSPKCLAWVESDGDVGVRASLSISLRDLRDLDIRGHFSPWTKVVQNLPWDDK